MQFFGQIITQSPQPLQRSASMLILPAMVDVLFLLNTAHRPDDPHGAVGTVAVSSTPCYRRCSAL
jgi:hypothetical protein